MHVVSSKRLSLIKMWNEFIFSNVMDAKFVKIDAISWLAD